MITHRFKFKCNAQFNQFKPAWHTANLCETWLTLIFSTKTPDNDCLFSFSLRSSKTLKKFNDQYFSTFYFYLIFPPHDKFWFLWKYHATFLFTLGWLLICIWLLRQSNRPCRPFSLRTCRLFAAILSSKCWCLDNLLYPWIHKDGLLWPSLGYQVQSKFFHFG